MEFENKKKKNRKTHVNDAKRKIKVFCGTNIFMRMSSHRTVKFE